MKTLATLFSGGGGMEAGAIAAGFTPIWGIEADADVVSVYARNFGPHCIVSAVEDVDYSTLQTPYHLHGSPSCRTASLANHGEGETAEDISAAKAMARAIKTLRPPTVTLENVWRYRKYESFKIILRALEESGYAFGYWHLNSADYGVPQTRKRLILIASKTHRPRRPQATHSERGPSAQTDLFGGEPLRKWVGWYEAIEDLLDTLPVAKKDKRLKEPCEWDAECGPCRDGVCRGHFAPWQLERLPELFEPALVRGDNSQQEITAERQYRRASEPSPTVRGAGARAFIAHPTADCDWFMTRDEREPVFSILANGNGTPRAFIVDGKPASYEGDLQITDGDNPVVTITASQTRHPFRAFLVSAHQSDSAEVAVPVRNADEPTVTVNTHTGGHVRAFLVGGANTSETQAAEGVGVSKHDEPTRCVNASNSAHWRAWLSQGRVVSMTPRALARFQSVPDSYLLPDKNGLACKVIGNMVAPLQAQRICESITGKEYAISSSVEREVSDAVA